MTWQGDQDPVDLSEAYDRADGSGEFDDVRSGKNLRRHFTVILTQDAGHWQIAAGRVKGVEER